MVSCKELSSAKKTHVHSVIVPTSAIFTVTQIVRDLNYNCSTSITVQNLTSSCKFVKDYVYCMPAADWPTDGSRPRQVVKEKQNCTGRPSGLKQQRLRQRRARRGRAEAKEHQDKAWTQQVHSKQKAVFKKAKSGKEGSVGEKCQYTFYWQKLGMLELRGARSLSQWTARIQESLQKTALQVLEVNRVSDDTFEV